MKKKSLLGRVDNRTSRAETQGKNFLTINTEKEATPPYAKGGIWTSLYLSV